MSNSNSKTLSSAKSRSTVARVPKSSIGAQWASQGALSQNRTKIETAATRRDKLVEELKNELRWFGPCKNMPWRNDPLALAMHARRMKEICNEA